MQLYAHEVSQKFKEGCYILERAKIRAVIIKLDRRRPEDDLRQRNNANQPCGELTNEYDHEEVEDEDEQGDINELGQQQQQQRLNTFVSDEINESEDEGSSDNTADQDDEDDEDEGQEM
jgi:hypothetical protein